MAELPTKILKSISFDVDVTLRTATASDALEYSIYLKQMVAESYKNMNYPKDAFDKSTLTEHAEALQKRQDDQAGFLLVAFLGEQIVGSFSLKPELAPFLKHCASFGMAVLKGMQGKGLGKSLLEYGLSQAQALGRNNITLHVRAHNAPAIQLYEKFGFKKIGVLEKFALVDGEFMDEFIYQKIY
jgi:putative acetyltransferase